MSLPRTSFLTWIAEFLHERFADSDVPLRMEISRVVGDQQGHTEQLLIDVDIPGGVDANRDYNSATQAWRRGEFPVAEFVTVAVSESGEVYLVGEDDMSFAVTVNHPSQFVDLIEFFRSPLSSGDPDFTTVALDTLLGPPQGVFPRPDGLRAVSLEDLLDSDLPSDLRPVLQAWLRQDLDAVVNHGGEEWTEVLKQVGETFPELVHPYVGDPGVVIGRRREAWQEPEGLKSRAVDATGDFRIVWPFRSSRLPSLYAREFFMHVEEGQQLLRQCPLQDAGALANYLSDTSVRVPASHLDALRIGLEWACLRRRINDRMSAFSTESDPQVFHTYLMGRRIDALDDLSRGEDLERSLWDPAPFPVERALHQWERSTRGEASVATGFAAVGSVLRTHVLPAVVELQRAGVWADLPNRVTGSFAKGRPLTDGQWLELGRALLDRVAGELELSRGPLEALERNDELFQRLLSARNAWAHSTEADRSQLLIDLNAVLDQTLPHLRDASRTTWHGLRLVVPASLQYLDGRLIVDAFDLSGLETPLRPIRAEVNGGLENFPTGEVVLLGEGRGLPLGAYVRWSPSRPGLGTIGLYDKGLGSDEMKYLEIR